MSYSSLPASGSISVGSTGHEAWHEVIHDGLKGNDFFVPWAAGNMEATIQAKIDEADAAGGGVVILGPGNFLLATGGQTNSHGDKCNLLVPENVHLRGQGCGNQRSGGTASGARNAMTELENTATPALGGADFHVVSYDKASPDWRGARISDLHIEDTASHADSLLNVSGLNGMLIDYVSLGQAGKAGSKCLWVQTTSGGGQPSQYGRVTNCNFYASTHGIWVDGNNPDWEINGTQIQHLGGATPVSGSTGIYIDSNAWRVYGGEVQFFDRGIHLDGSNSRARHFTGNTIHLEAHQSASGTPYEAMAMMTGSGSSEEMYPLWLAVEYANSGKVADMIKIGTNVVGAKFAHNRVRDSRWITTTGDPDITDNGTGTVVV